MSITVRQIVRQILSTQKVCSRSVATAEAAISPSLSKVALRTTDNNPSNHTKEQIGLFYNLDSKVKQKLFPSAILPKQFEINCKTFAEANILIRNPAVEIISYMKNANYNHPVIKYLIYGKKGCGKSMTLAHVIHYAHVNDFVIVHIPSVWKWFCVAKEIVSVDQDSTLIDLPLEAGSWLKQFSQTNGELLERLNLRVSKDYVWNKRETTPKDAPIMELLSHGINRVKYGYQVIEALINELKMNSNNGVCKTLIAIDGFNGFFNTWTIMKTPEKVRVVPEKVTLTQIFLSAVKSDWKNGAIVLTADQLATSLKYPIDTHLPFHMLGKKGIEHIDPFIPINVPALTEAEFHNLMDYLEEKKWLQKPEGRNELEFLSQKNPEYLIKLCASL